MVGRSWISGWIRWLVQTVKPNEERGKAEILKFHLRFPIAPLRDMQRRLLVHPTLVECCQCLSQGWIQSSYHEPVDWDSNVAVLGMENQVVPRVLVTQHRVKSVPHILL